MTPLDGRPFGLTVGGAFLGLAGLAWWRGHVGIAGGSALVGVTLVLAGLVLPGMLRPLARGWTRLAAALSLVTTPLLMGVIYYLVLTPVALALRTRGVIRPVVRRPSYWVSRASTVSDMRKQF